MEGRDLSAEIEAAVAAALADVLEAQLERVLELILKEITGLATQMLTLQARVDLAASAQNAVGAASGLSDLVAQAAAKGGRFL